MGQLQRGARLAFSRGELDWEDDTIVAVPVSGAPDIVSDVYLSQMAAKILGGAGQRTTVTTSLVGLSSGRVRHTCASFVHAAVATGGTYAGTVFVKSTGNDASSLIISYHARTAGPVPTNDQDIDVTVPAEGLFTT